jgi:hypothetical protein
MLPAAVLQQVTKALTSCLLEQVEGQAPAAGELQPCDELAAVHVMACRCVNFASQPHPPAATCQPRIFTRCPPAAHCTCFLCSAGPGCFVSANVQVCLPSPGH